MKNVLQKWKEKYLGLPINIKASLWFLISAFLQRGISVITTPIFTRLMTTAEYGEFNVFYSWYGIVTIFVTLNLFFGVFVRGLVKFEEERALFTSSMEGLCLTLILCGLVIYFLFSNLFNKIFSMTTPKVLCMMLMIWANSAFSFWAAEKRVDLEYKRLVALSVSSVILTPLLQVILILNMSDKVMARILGMVIVSAILYIPLFFCHINKGRKFFYKKYWKYALKFNIPLIPHYLSQTVLNSADRLMINSIIGASEAGIYSLAYSLSQIMTVFNSALMQTIEPWLYRRIRDNEIDQISKAAYPSFIIVGIANIFLVALAPEVVALFAPIEYANTIWVIPPIAISVYFQFSYTFFAVFEFYYEKTQYITAATMIGAILNIVLNYIFIPIFGYYAAGYTTLFCYILYSLFHFIFMNRLIKKYHPGQTAYSKKILGGITLSIMLMGLILLSTYSHRIIRYGILICGLLIMIIKRKTLLIEVKKIVGCKNL